jgi:hypothetical protein
MALEVLRGAGERERMASATVAAQANHQQIDFFREARQLVYGDAIDGTSIDTIEARQTLPRLAQQLVHAHTQFSASTRGVDGARRADHLHDANAGPVGSRQLTSNG